MLLFASLGIVPINHNQLKCILQTVNVECSVRSNLKTQRLQLVELLFVALATTIGFLQASKLL